MAAREAAVSRDRLERKAPSPAIGIPEIARGTAPGGPSALREAPLTSPLQSPSERVERQDDLRRGTATGVKPLPQRAPAAAKKKEEQREQDFDLVLFATAPSGFDFEAFLGRNAGRLGGYLGRSRPLDVGARRRIGELLGYDGRMGGGTLEISLPAERIDDLLDALRGRSPIEILARERPPHGPGGAMAAILIHVSRR